MKKLWVVFGVAVLSLWLTGLGFAQDTAKQGSDPFTCMYSGTSVRIPLDEGNFLGSYEAKGVLVSDSGKGPFHNMSQHHVGVIHFGPNGGKLTGYVTLADPQGDKVLIEFHEDGAKPPPAENSGTGTIIHGTGKFKGVEGTMEYTRWYVRPATPDSFQAMAQGRIIWKMP